MRYVDTPGLGDLALGDNNQWNEVHFLTRETFAAMAPSVIRLELGRISACIRSVALDDPTRESLVAARYSLSRFGDLVSDRFETTDLRECEDLLGACLLALALRPQDREGDLDGLLNNISDRLAYVLERLRRLR